MQKTENAHRGSTLDSFLHEEGIYHQVTTAAVLEVFVEEAREEMERQKRSQSWLARKMGTSRAVLSRLFQPKPSGVTVSTLVRFADALDKDIRIELIDRPAEKRQTTKSQAYCQENVASPSQQSGPGSTSDVLRIDT